MSPDSGHHCGTERASLIDVYVNVNKAIAPAAVIDAPVCANARQRKRHNLRDLRASHMPGNMASTKITVSSCPVSNEASALAGL